MRRRACHTHFFPSLALRPSARLGSRGELQLRLRPYFYCSKRCTMRAGIGVCQSFLWLCRGEYDSYPLLLLLPDLKIWDSGLRRRSGRQAKRVSFISINRWIHRYHCFTSSSIRMYSIAVTACRTASELVQVDVSQEEDIVIVRFVKSHMFVQVLFGGFPVLLPHGDVIQLQVYTIKAAPSHRLIRGLLSWLSL